MWIWDKWCRCMFMYSKMYQIFLDQRPKSSDSQLLATPRAPVDKNIEVHHLLPYRAAKTPCTGQEAQRAQSAGQLLLNILDAARARMDRVVGRWLG